MLKTIFFSSFSLWNAVLPAARYPNFQTEDISILKQLLVWNFVKMSMVLFFYYDEACRFSDEIYLIFDKFY